MNGTFQRLWRSAFVRNVALLASGTAGAQAISMAFMPVITRLYGPDAFGQLGVFLAGLAIVAPIGALTYPIAIVLPRHDDDARGLAKLSFLIALATALIMALLVLVARDQIAKLLHMEAVAAFLLLVPIAMFFSSLQDIMKQWLIRKRQFSITARVAVSQSFIVNSLKAGGGLLYPAGVVLMVLQTVGSIIYAAQLWFAARRWEDGGEQVYDSARSHSPLRSIAYKHWDFPCFRMPQVLINAFSQGLPILVLASFIGPAPAGLFTLAKSVLMAPVTLIGTAVSDVAYPRIVELINKRKNPSLIIIKAGASIGVVAFVPLFFVFLFGPWLFENIFGKEWSIAGAYARWLSIMLFVFTIARPAVAAIPALNAQGLLLVLECLFIVLRAAAMIIGVIVFDSALTGVALYSMISAAFYIAIIGLALSRCGVTETQVLNR